MGREKASNRTIFVFLSISDFVVVAVEVKFVHLKRFGKERFIEIPQSMSPFYIRGSDSDLFCYLYTQEGSLKSLKSLLLKVE